jgi:glycosyltransferase involved in cell wall biosynthesis
VRILYLVNAYPRVTLTFIRREILAIESLGHEVIRVSVRPPDGSLIDPADLAESARTRFLLGHGLLGLMPAVLFTLLRHPVRFVRTFCEAVRLSHKSAAGFFKHVAYFIEACELTRIARRERAEHVHAHFATNPPLVALLATSLGAPGFSFTVHGMEEAEQAPSFKIADKMAAARFTVAISSYGQAQLHRFGYIPDHERVHVVHCGLDAGFLAVPASDPPAVPDLLFIGRLCPQKQPLLLIEAVRSLVAEGIPIRVRFAGSGELDALVRERIRAAGLEAHCILLGSIDEAQIVKEIDACRALVLPSCAEGIPMVLMEAMARRRPVISTFVSGIPELVRDGKEGWLVPVGDGPALAVALKAALAAPPAELARLGASGAARVRERHDIHACARNLAALFSRYAQA